jgi:hypothetical protein
MTEVKSGLQGKRTHEQQLRELERKPGVPMRAAPMPTFMKPGGTTKPTLPMARHAIASSQSAGAA